jgi:hypothetical protein
MSYENLKSVPSTRALAPIWLAVGTWPRLPRVIGASSPVVAAMDIQHGEMVTDEFQ